MADDIWSRYGNSLPMAASPSDMIVGETEWGAPVYQSRLGAQYYEPLVAEQPRGSAIGGLASAFADDPLGAIGSGIGSLASGVWDAVSAPARAWRGEPVTTADAFNTAGVAQLGSFGGVAPEGALRVGAMRSARELEDAIGAIHPEVRLDIGGNPSRGYTVGRIVVPESQRGQGVGTAVMNEILESSRATGTPVGLTPSSDFGGSISGLNRFYRGLGFEPNKGRNRDLSISEALIWRPE